jgi:hypothetical protein
MCPVCAANIALIAAGASSSGGLTAFALKKFCARTQNRITQTKRKKNEIREEANKSRNCVGN